jgi:hypothetical protein
MRRAGVGADSTADTALSTQHRMAGLIDCERGLAHGAGIGAHSAGGSLKGDTALRVELHLGQVVAGPPMQWHRESRGGTGGRAGHGDTGDTGLRAEIDVRRAGGETALGRHIHDRVRRADIGAGAAAGTCRQEPHLRQRTRWAEVPPAHDSILGARDEAFEPVVHGRTQQVPSIGIAWLQHAFQIWLGSGEAGKRGSEIKVNFIASLRELQALTFDVPA